FRSPWRARRIGTTAQPRGRPRAHTGPAMSLTAPTYSFSELSSAQAAGVSPLAEECALAIGYNGLNQAVMMVSPADLEDFVLGFSLSNGLIASADELYDLRLSGS